MLRHYPDRFNNNTSQFGHTVAVGQADVKQIDPDPAFALVQNEICMLHISQLNITGRPGRKVRVYPNPTTGTHTIALPDKMTTDSTIVEIYGMMGEKILPEEFAWQTTYKISLAHQPPEMYILRVIAGQEAGTMKVIKR